MNSQNAASHAFRPSLSNAFCRCNPIFALKIAQTGEFRPIPRPRASIALTLAEYEEISREMVVGDSFDQLRRDSDVYPLYLLDAIRFGYKALRGYKLRHLLEEIAKAENTVRLYYAFNHLRDAFELLVSGAWLAYEMRWRLFAGGTMEDFLRDVELAVDAEAPRVGCTLVGMELEEFRAVRDQTNVGRYRTRRN